MRGVPDLPDDHDDAEFVVYDDKEYSDSTSRDEHLEPNLPEDHPGPKALTGRKGLMATTSQTLYPGIDDRIFTPDEWGSAFPARYSPHYRESMAMPVRKLMVHHAASSVPKSPAAVAPFIRSLENYGENRDGAACEYHYLITSFGDVIGGFMDTRGCHSAQVDVSYSSRTLYNKSAIGVCFIGNFYQTGQRPTPEAIAAFNWLVNWLVDTGRCSEEIFRRRDSNGLPGYYRHRDVFGTVCPADVELDFAQMFVRNGQVPQPPTPTPDRPLTPIPDNLEDPVWTVVYVEDNPHIFIGLAAKSTKGQVHIAHLDWLPDINVVNAYIEGGAPQLRIPQASLRNVTANFVPDRSLDGAFARIEQR